MRPLTKAAGIFAALGFVLNLILLAFAISSNREQREKQIDTLAETSEATGRMISLKLSNLAKEARILAGEAALGSGDLKHAENILRAAAATTDHHYILGDQSATQLINTSAPRGADRVVTREPGELQAIFSGKNMILTEPRESRFVGKKVRGEFKGERFYGIRVPVREGGEIRYVLTLLARPSALRNVLLEAYRPQGWGASIIDQKGRIVTRSHGDEQFAGRPAPPEVLDRSARAPRGIVDTIDSDGKPSISSMTNIPGTEWRIAVWAPHEVLFQQRSLLFPVIALGNMVLFAGLILFWSRPASRRLADRRF